MSRRELIRWFGIRLAISYLLLVLPWPGWGAAFSMAYRGASNFAFRVTGVGEYLYMGVPAVFHPRGDVEMAMKNPSTGQVVRMEFSSRDWAYLSMAASVALILAIPGRWPKRYAAGGILILLTSAFCGLRIVMGAIYGLTSVGVFNASEGTRRILGSIMMGFSATPINSFVVPILLWLVVLYWTYDWKSLQQTLTNLNPDDA